MKTKWIVLIIVIVIALTGLGVWYFTKLPKGSLPARLGDKNKGIRALQKALKKKFADADIPQTGEYEINTGIAIARFYNIDKITGAPVTEPIKSFGETIFSQITGITGNDVKKYWIDNPSNN